MDQRNIYSISEVAQKVGFKPHVIRFYEKEFNLIIPREENNRRYFTNKEVEQLLYIKKLKDGRMSNKEIKEMLNGEGDMNNKDYTNIINIEKAEKPMQVEIIKETKKDDTFIDLKNEILTILEEYNYKDEISGLKDKIDELKHELSIEESIKEKDVLICENARLKLKIKEKSYEIAELKDKLKRQENKKISIFKRILKTKNASL